MLSSRIYSDFDELSAIIAEPTVSESDIKKQKSQGIFKLLLEVELELCDLTLSGKSEQGFVVIGR